MPAIHTAAIEHATGIDMFVSRTEEGLDAQVAAYCRSHWETIDGASGCPEPPESDPNCIERYFNGHDHDSLTVDCCRLDPPATTKTDLVKAMTTQAFLESLQYAVDAAGGGGFNWKDSKGMTVEDLATMLAPNGVRFAFMGGAKMREERDLIESAANRAAAALPLLP